MLPVICLVLLAACADRALDTSPQRDTDSDSDTDTDTDTDTDADTDTDDAFADALVSFKPGAGVSYGQDALPDVVLGPPHGGGASAGSLDVVSLGEEGVIVLAFDDIGLVDGPGVDLLVFENPFGDWFETGAVAVSEDGKTWAEWPCDPAEAQGGCAGWAYVYANPDNTLDPTDPSQAGGDGFDLADLGLSRARYVRVRDSGANDYAGVAGGFDLDAIAVVNGEPLD